MIASFLIYALIVAAFSTAIAFILDIQAVGMRWQRRALYAALGGSLLPSLLPILFVLLEAGFSEEFWVVLVTLFIGGLFLSAAVGFPITYFFCKRRDAARNPPNPEKTFE